MAEEAPDFFANVKPIRPHLALRSIEDYIQHGGSDGGDGGMEARLARLESDMEYVKRDVSELRADVREVRADIATVKTAVAEIKVTLSHLPGKGYINTAVLGGLAVIAALTVFADNIRALVGSS